MDDKLLNELLKNKKESDWLEFKRKVEMYDANGKIIPQQKDEFIKDILGLANGNSNIIRKTKYLIVGVDNATFDESGIRVLHNVNYEVPTQSEVIKLLNSACSPAVVGLECDIYPFNDTNLYIITIPPTFDIHETTRELSASGHFNKHTVFMRQDEHTVPASVRDGVAIQELKHIYRQEIANPSAWWIGAIVGCFITLLFRVGESEIAQTDSIIPSFVARIIIALGGAFFGATIGWLVKEINSTRYDWRYWTKSKRIAFILFLLIAGVIYYFWQIR